MRLKIEEFTTVENTTQKVIKEQKELVNREDKQ